MSQARYLTKSKFKLGMECPTKLYYADKAEYANQKIADSFLAALADGGFQVGALARCYFPEGIRIETPNDEVALELTESYLSSDKVVLFEAGFRFENLLIRADVVVKDGNTLELYEVKAKSCDFDDQAGMLKTSRGVTTIGSKWTEHLADVAFQKYVVSKARPDLQVSAHLMLVDKRVVAPTDGLNQRFRLVRDSTGKRVVEVSDAISDQDLDPPILRKIRVDEACDLVYSDGVLDLSFAEGTKQLADAYVKDQKLVTAPHPGCKDCEYRLADHSVPGERVSGFKECWSQSLGWKDEDFHVPNSFDVWFVDKKKIVQKELFRISDLDEDFFGPEENRSQGLTRKQRQWLQVEKTQKRDPNVWVDRDNLKHQIDGWERPLHFIDFEGSSPAIPFKKGRRPYEQVLFQFSHHTIDGDEKLRHESEFISVEPGAFPNYDLVRALRDNLGDKGAIFRYHDYENTLLCAVYSQLMAEEPGVVPDRDELCDFIRSITKPTGKLSGQWEPGPRNMVDLHELVCRFYYDPATNGSVSIKDVLPATLNSSEFLKDRYSQPIYGGNGEIRSLNFSDQIWVVRDETTGTVRDPYTLLDPLFDDESAADYQALMAMDEIKDGGAATTAYSKLQFEDIPVQARDAVRTALLRYCELDTLAMVMIYEAWRAEL